LRKLPLRSEPILNTRRRRNGAEAAKEKTNSKQHGSADENKTIKTDETTMNVNTLTEVKPIIPTEPAKMSFQKITCQQCQAEFLVAPATSSAACNFCGTQMASTTGQAAISPPDGILPFTVTKQQYQQALLAWLSEGEYTPDDILSSSAFGEVNGVYVPMHVYQGAYHGHWSATSGFKREVKYYEKNSEGEQVEKVKTVTDWRPSSGQVAGEFRVLVFAGSHLGIHDEMIRFASEAAYAEHDAEPFDSVATAGFNLMDFSGDEDVLWHAAGESKATAIARAQIVRQIPGDEHKDLQHHLFWDRQPARKVYLPCWFVAYKYKDQSFHACLDGRNAARIDGVRPEDQARKAQVKKYFLPAHVTAGVAVGVWGLLKLGQSSFSVTMFWVGALLAAAMYGAAIYRKRKLINASRARRLEILRTFQTGAGLAPTAAMAVKPSPSNSNEGLLSPLIRKLSQVADRWGNWKGSLRDRCLKVLRKAPGHRKPTL
jgi:ribosomal protein S27E